MADVYEQNLASKSTLTTTDYIRVVGSDNVSYKQLVSDVAKKIIENYTGSTLAGSAQSVKSAVDSLNSKIGDISFSAKEISATTSVTLSNNYRGKVTLITSNTQHCGEYIVYSTGTGAVAAIAVKALGGGITISGSTNTLTFTLTTTGGWAIWFETYKGTITWP